MFLKLLVVVSIVALLSTLICGAWIGTKRSGMSESDLASSASFHRSLGSFSVVVAVLTLAWVFIKLRA